MSAYHRAGILTGSTVLIAVLALASGCARQRQPVELSAAGRWLHGYPGQYTAETMNYMERVKFPGTSNRDTVFTGPYPCDTTGCTTANVDLTVIPEEKAFQIDWDRAFRNEKNEGAIVAMIRNDTEYPYPAFGLEKHDSAYVWVGPINADGSERAVGYYKINASNGTATAAPKTYKTVSYCNLPHSNGRSRSSAHGQHPPSNRCFSVNYTPTATSSTATTATTTTTTKAEKLPLFTNVSYTSAMFRSNGTWISCVYGCCEIGYAN